MPNPGVVLDLAVDAPETAPGSTLLSLVVLVVLAVLLVVVRYRAAFRNLPAERKRVREAAREARHRATPGIRQYRTDRLDDVDDLHGDLTGLFDESLEGERRTTYRYASRELLSGLRLAYQEYTGWIPSLIKRTVRWAVLVSLFGAVAVSTHTLADILDSDPNATTLSKLLSSGSNATSELATWLVDLVGAYPYTGFLFSLVLSYTLLLGQWLFQHWYIVAILMLSAGLGTWAASQRFDGDPPRLTNTPWLFALGTILTTAVVWTTGTLLGWLGGLVGLQAIGDLVGFLASLVVGVYLVAVFGWPSLRVAGLRLLDEYGTDHAFVAGLAGIGYRLTQALSVVSAVFTLFYILHSVVSGAWLTLLSALLSAGGETQAVVVLAVTVLLAGVGKALAETAPDIRRAWAMATAQAGVRAQLVARGLPFAAVAILYALVYSFTRSIPVALGVAIVGAITVRSLTSVAFAAAYSKDWETTLQRLIKPQPLHVTVLAYRLDIHEGSQYVVDVNGDTYASPCREDAVDAAIDAIYAIEGHENPPQSVEWWHANWLFDYGILDIEETREKLHERVRKAVLTPLREDNPTLPRERLERAVEDYPEDVYQARRREMEPYVHWDDQSVTLVRDVWQDYQHRARGQSIQ